MAKQAAARCVLLLCTAHALMVSVSALPSHWSSFYYDQRALAGRQQQQAAMCDASAVSPASLTCKSARLVVPGGNITHIHVCPSDSDPTAVCFNSKLFRCCPNEGVACKSRTTLKIGNKVVEVKIYTTVTGGYCIDFSEEIRRCCPSSDTGLPEICEIPQPTEPPPSCVPKRDVYFVVDSTDSVGDDIFCRFGYVLQLITAAVNPQGRNGARIAAVLFEFQPHTTSRYLFGLDDSCNDTVSTKIPRVVYEYYRFGQGDINRQDLQYPNVRATSTQPYSALNEVAGSAETITSRPSSVIIMTDGKSHQNVERVIDRLKKISDPLIAAGIGTDTDTQYLVTLASNSSTVVYESDRNKPIEWSKRIIEVMRDTGALCAAEAKRILNALNKTQETDMKNYCESCLWESAANRKCDGLMPVCGAQNLMMQSVVESNSNKAFSEEWERLLLEGEIAKAVEDVIAKISG